VVLALQAYPGSIRSSSKFDNLVAVARGVRTILWDASGNGMRKVREKDHGKTNDPLRQYSWR